MKRTKASPGNEELIKRLCDMDESINIEFKRASGKMVHKALEAIVAFANTEGGFLVLGMEDPKKAKGADRLFGIQENPEAVDELHEQVAHRVTPSIEGITWRSLPCTLCGMAQRANLRLLRFRRAPKCIRLLRMGLGNAWKEAIAR